MSQFDPLDPFDPQAIAGNPYVSEGAKRRTANPVAPRPTATGFAPDQYKGTWGIETARSLGAGLENDIVRGLPFIANALTGDTEGRVAAAQEYMAEQERARSLGPAIQSFDDAEAAGGGIGNYGAALGYMAAGLVPDILSVATGAGIGAAVGRRVARGAVRRGIADTIENQADNVAARIADTTAARARARQAASGAMDAPDAVSNAVRVAQAEVNERSRKAAMGEAARLSGRTPRVGIGADTPLQAQVRAGQAAVQSATTAGSRVGGTAGGFATLAPQDMAEKAADPNSTTADMWTLAAGNVAASATQMIPLERFVGRFGKEARDAVAKKADGWMRRYAKETGTQAGAEGSQEVVQAALQNASHAFVEENLDTLIGPEAFDEYMVSFLAGGILGGAMGAGGQGARDLGGGARRAYAWTADQARALRDKASPVYQDLRARMSKAAEWRLRPETDEGGADGGGPTFGERAAKAANAGMDAAKSAADAFKANLSRFTQFDDLDAEVDQNAGTLAEAIANFEDGGASLFGGSSLADSQMPFRTENRLQNRLLSYVPKESGWFDNQQAVQEMGTALERLFKGDEISAEDRMTLLSSGIPTWRLDMWRMKGPEAYVEWRKLRENDSSVDQYAEEYGVQESSDAVARREVLDEDDPMRDVDETDGGAGDGFNVARQVETRELSDYAAARSALRDRYREIKAAKAAVENSKFAGRADTKGYDEAEAEILREAEALGREEAEAKKAAVIKALGQPSGERPLGAFVFIENRSTKRNEKTGGSGVDAYKAALADPAYVRLAQERPIEGMKQTRNVLVNLATASRVYQGQNRVDGREAVMGVLYNLIDAGVELDLKSLTPGPVQFKADTKAEPETVYVLTPDDIRAVQVKARAPYDTTVADKARAKKEQAGSGNEAKKRREVAYRPGDPGDANAAARARGYRNADRWADAEYAQLVDKYLQKFPSEKRSEERKNLAAGEKKKLRAQARRRVETIAARERQEKLRAAGQEAEIFQADETLQGEDPFREEEQRFQQGQREAPPGERRADGTYVSSMSVVADVAVGGSMLGRTINRVLRRMRDQRMRRTYSNKSWVEFIALPRAAKMRAEQDTLLPLYRMLQAAVEAVETAADRVSFLKSESRKDKNSAVTASGNRAYESALERAIVASAAYKRARTLDAKIAGALDSDRDLLARYDAFVKARAAGRKARAEGNKEAYAQARADAAKVRNEAIDDLIGMEARSIALMKEARDSAVPAAEAAREEAIEKTKASIGLAAARKNLRRAERKLDSVANNENINAAAARFLELDAALQRAFEKFIQVDAFDIEAVAIDAAKEALRVELESGAISRRSYSKAIRDIDAQGAAHPRVVRLVDPESGGFADPSAASIDGRSASPSASITSGRADNPRVIPSRKAAEGYAAAEARARQAYFDLHRLFHMEAESASPSERDLFDFFRFIAERVKDGDWNRRGFKPIREYVLALQELADWGYTPTLAQQISGNSTPGQEFTDALAELAGVRESRAGGKRQTADEEYASERDRILAKRPKARREAAEKKAAAERAEAARAAAVKAEDAAREARLAKRDAQAKASDAAAEAAAKPSQAKLSGPVRPPGSVIAGRNKTPGFIQFDDLDADAVDIDEVIKSLRDPTQKYLTRGEIRAKGAYYANWRENHMEQVQVQLLEQLEAMETADPGSGLRTARDALAGADAASLTPAQKATDAYVHPLLDSEEGVSKLLFLLGNSQSVVRLRRVAASLVRGVDAGLVPGNIQAEMYARVLAELHALKSAPKIGSISDPTRPRDGDEAHPNWVVHDVVVDAFATDNENNGTVDRLAAELLTRVEAKRLAVPPFLKKMLALIAKSRYARSLKVNAEVDATGASDVSGSQMSFDDDVGVLTVSTKDVLNLLFDEGNVVVAMDPVAVFVHEATHGMTMLGEAAAPRLSKDLDVLVAHVRKEFEKKFGKGSSNLIYGLGDTQEFLAESFSNMKFQDMLRQISAAGTESFKTAWDQFKHLVLRLLGLRTTPANFTALDEALTLGVSLMRSSAEAADAKKGYRQQFDDLGDGLEAAASTPADGHDYAAETAMLNEMAMALGVSANLEVRSMGAQLRRKGGSYDRGTRIIEINSNLEGPERVEVLMHELGHHIVWDAVAKVVGWDAVKGMSLDQAFDVIAESNPKLYAALRKDYDAYLAKHPPGSFYVRAMADRKPLHRSRRADGEGRLDRSQVGEKTFTGASGFHEWIADNIARALTTQKKPVGMVAKFFGKIATAIRSAWNKLPKAVRDTYLPAKSVDMWVRDMFNAESAAMKTATGSAASRKKVIATTKAAVNAWAGRERDTDYSEPAGPRPKLDITDVGDFMEAMRVMLKPQERQILERVFNRGVVRDRVRRALDNQVKAGETTQAARDELLKNYDDAESGMDWRLAIGYMLWSNGQLTMGPQGGSAMLGMADSLMAFMKLAGEGALAHQILSDIATGVVNRMHDAGRTYDVRERAGRRFGAGQKALNAATKTYEKLTEPLSKVFSSQMQRMRESGIPSMARLAALLYRPNDTTGDDNGLLPAVFDKSAQFMRKADRIFRELTPRERVKAMQRLQRQQVAPTGKNENVDNAVRMTQELMAEAHAYMTEAGLDVGTVENFFPIVFDMTSDRTAKTLRDIYLAKEADGSYRYEADIRSVFERFDAGARKDAEGDVTGKPLPDPDPEALKYFEKQRKKWTKDNPNNPIAEVNASIVAAITTGSINAIRKQIEASHRREDKRAASEREIGPDLERAYDLERRYMNARIKQLQDAGLGEDDGAKAKSPQANRAGLPFEQLVDDLVARATAERTPGKASYEIDSPEFAGMRNRISKFIYEKGNADDIKKFASTQSKDAGEVLGRYFVPMVRSAEFSRRLGGGETGTEGFDALLAQMKEEGATEAQLQEAQNAVAAALGTYGANGSPVLRMISPALADRFSGPNSKAFVQGSQAYQNLRLLPLSVLASLVDPMGVAVRTGGDFSTAWQGFKVGIKSLFNKDLREELRGALEVVSAAEDVVPALAASGAMFDRPVPAAKKLNDFVFRFNGMHHWIEATRFMALRAGHLFLLKHAEAAQGPAGARRDTALRYLAELGLEPADVTEIIDPDGKREVGINDKTREALSRFVNSAILRPNSQQVPQWYNDPYVGIVTQYKGFLYALNDQIGGRISRELAEGNMAVLLAAMTYLPIVMMAEILRELLQHGTDGNPRREDWGPDDYAWLATQRTGLLGPKFEFANSAAEDAKMGRMPGSSQVGPTGSQAREINAVFSGRASGAQAFENALPFNAIYKNHVNPLEAAQ